VTLTYSELAGHLASGKLAPAYILTGEQDYLRELAGKEILAVALGDADRQFNFDKFDGQIVSAEPVVVACNLFPMMAERRGVFVRRAGKLIAGADTDALVGYIENPSPQTVLVLELEKAPDARRKVWKSLAAKATVVRCDPLKDRQVEGWITREAKRLKLGLGREEVRYLAMEFGSDLRRQLSELEKISLYDPGKSLDVEQMSILLGKGKAQSIFKLTDAVADRNAASALKQLGRLLDEGEPALPILALLDRIVGQLLSAKELDSRKMRAAEIASVLGVPGWLVEKLVRQSRRFGKGDLARGLDALARCDRNLKTTAVPARLVLEGLILSLCGGASSKR
jgi:DNA polymerase-3 subunit delta